MTHRLRLGLVAVAVAVVAVVGALTAQERPSPEALVLRAVRVYIATSGCCDVGRFDVLGVVIAAADDRYAAVELDGFDRSGDSIGRATTILRREAGTWAVLVLGSDDLGCRVPSPAVRRELGIGCSSG